MRKRGRRRLRSECWHRRLWRARPTWVRGRRRLRSECWHRRLWRATPTWARGRRRPRSGWRRRWRRWAARSPSNNWCSSRCGDVRGRRREMRRELVRRQHAIEADLLDVGACGAPEDRLELAAAALLGRSGGALAPPRRGLAHLRIALVAVGELGRKRRERERALAQRHLACLGTASRAREATTA